jgi:DNA-binding CsgD family transcriptional regulator
VTANQSPLTQTIISPRLIGREAELAGLEQALTTTLAGVGQCFTVVGEAGVGKSRLLAEIRSRAEAAGYLTLPGHCFEPDLTFPYASLIDALRAYFARLSPALVAQSLGPLAPEIVKLLPELALTMPQVTATVALEPEAEKRRLFESLAQFLTSLTQPQANSRPLLLILEDIHWADDTSLDFIHFLARRLITFPILLIASYRSDAVTPQLRQTLARLNRQRLAQEIILHRLGRAETEAMLAAIFEVNRPIRAEFLEAIYGLTEGNPFFIEEVLKSLVSAGDIFYTMSGWDRKPLAELHIPRSVQEAVRQRLAQVSEPAHRLLTLAAVAGRRFDFSLLQQLTEQPESELLALIKELITAQLVVEESAEQFAFRHALTQATIYNDLLARERRDLHRAIAGSLLRLYLAGEKSFAAQLANLTAHFYRAEQWDEVLLYGQQAGERALALYAPRVAAEHFSQALQAGQKLNRPAPAALYRGRAKAYQITGIFEPARADLATALAIAQAGQDHRLSWEILLELGFAWIAHDYVQAGHYFSQALELARTMNEPATIGHSLNRLGNYLVNVDKPRQGLPYHQEALLIFEQLQAPAGLAETLDLLGTTLVASGNWRQGAAYYQRAASLFQSLDQRQGLVSSLTMLTFRGGAYLNDTNVMPAPFGEALADGEMALALARQSGQQAAEAAAAVALAFSLGPQGDYGRALALAHLGLSLAEALEHRHWQTFARLALGVLQLDLLAADQARLELEHALALAQELGSNFFHNLASGYLVSACLLAGDVSRAEAVLALTQPALSELEEHSPSNSRGQVWAGRIELALARQDFGLALDFTERLIALAPNMAEGVIIPRLGYLRGQALLGLGRLAKAESTWQEALASALGQGFQPLGWRIQAGLAQLYLKQRRRPPAEAARRAAQDLIEKLAATVPDDQSRQKFIARALKSLPELPPLSARRAAKRAYDGLTWRERQVATLIAQGQSNRDIAEALVVSERTAATHVGNILNKLGFSSRSQIAAWAVEKGLTQ